MAYKYSDIIFICAYNGVGLAILDTQIKFQFYEDYTESIMGFLLYLCVFDYKGVCLGRILFLVMGIPFEFNGEKYEFSVHFSKS